MEKHGSLCTTLRREMGGITFAVDDVKPSTDSLWLGTLRESLEIRSHASVLFMANPETPALASEGCARNAEGIQKPLRAYVTRLDARELVKEEPIAAAKALAENGEITHPLIQAVHLAFSDHRPLVLSADSIGLTIVQGFGQHVHENTGKLRKRLVQHQNKKALAVRASSLTEIELMGGFFGVSQREKRFCLCTDH